MIKWPTAFVWHFLGMSSFSLIGINLFTKHVNKICLLLPMESSSRSSQASCKMFTFQPPLSSLLLVKFQIHVENSTFSVPFYPLWEGEVESGQLEHSWTLALGFSQDTFQVGEVSWGTAAGSQWANPRAGLEPPSQAPGHVPGLFPSRSLHPHSLGNSPIPSSSLPLVTSLQGSWHFWERRTRGSALRHFTSHHIHFLASRPHAI